MGGVVASSPAGTPVGQEIPMASNKITFKRLIGTPLVFAREPEAHQAKRPILNVEL
jgi:hypothetical protein